MFFGLAEVKSYAKNCCCAGCGTPLSQNVQPIRLILAQCEYPSFYRQVMDSGIRNWVSGCPKSAFDLKRPYFV